MKPKLKIKKGDNVIVISGRDRKKTGEVLGVFPPENRALVRGVNLAKKHQKPSPSNPGGVIEKELKIHLSNIAIVDPKSGKPTRVGYKRLKDGKKVRIARPSGEVID